MTDSKLYTLGVPTITGTGTDASNPNLQPALMANANKTPLRVLVRNISFGGVDVQIAFEAQVLNMEGGAQSFTLPAGTSESFVLAPGQKLFAATRGVNAKVCCAVSDALPLDIKS
jgi:hypothetical protein